MSPGDAMLKHNYKQINIIYVVLFLGIVILFGTSVFVRITHNFRFTISEQEEIGLIFKILLGVFIIILFPVSYIMHKRKIERLNKNSSLTQKLSAYKASLIVQL